MQHSEKAELTNQISSKLRSGILDWDLYQQTHSQHAWEISNTLAYSLAGGEIMFLIGDVRSHKTGEIKIAAYTQDFVLIHSGKPGPERPVFTVLPRRMLDYLEVRGAPPVLAVPSEGYHSTGSYRLWYGKVILSLPLERRRYNDDLERLAPLEGNDDLHNFAPSLWEDLSK